MKARLYFPTDANSRARAAVRHGYGNRLFVVPLKNGWTTVAKWCEEHGEVEIEDEHLSSYPDITFVVRNPDERLLSAWRNQFPDFTIEEVIDAVIDLPFTERNIHLAPQSWFFGDLVPTRVMDIKQLATELLMPRRNTSDASGFTLPDYRRDELRAAYAADWLLFEESQP
jgi:hypothetical protein